MDVARCDLHVHSIHSTDSGNFALRRARLGESYTEPERVYAVARRRGMTFVTISDHNTVDGALRIADKPGAFLSVEVTTRFPEDHLPLHVLVWNLTERDHAELQSYRSSVYELVDFLVERGLHHGLAHPLYRMGPPITVQHVERMMLLFGIWEGRNGARPEDQNTLACRLAAAVTPAYLEKLAERHDLAPRHRGRISLSAGSDDHGAIDIATTWTETDAETVDDFFEGLCADGAAIGGAHGSTVKLAHAVLSLFANAYRARGGTIPDPWRELVEELLDADAADAGSRHAAIGAATSAAVRLLGGRARRPLDVDSLPQLGTRVAPFLFSCALQAPYLATAQHHASSRRALRELEAPFFGVPDETAEPKALVFTDTFTETNGVAGTMRRLAAEAEGGAAGLTVVTAGEGGDHPGVITLAPDWSVPLPTYERLGLRFPALTDVLDRVERERPDVIQVATPGPVGAAGLIAAKLLGVPAIGSYHTELGPYAFHLTNDLIVAEVMDAYVDWFYRRCEVVLAPTRAIADSLVERGFDRVWVWGRGVDAERFSPLLRSEDLRRELLDGGDFLALSVGRISPEKRVDVLIAAYDRLRADVPGARLVVVGDGPARLELERTAPPGVTFAGEVHGSALARLYASADVFCFPSTTDTYGQVLLEAAASALPVVAVDAGPAREVMGRSGAALLVPPDDPASFAHALATLAASPDLRRELGERARATALELTWSRALDELRNAYRRTATTTTPSRRPIAA